MVVYESKQETGTMEAHKSRNWGNGWENMRKAVLLLLLLLLFQNLFICVRKVVTVERHCLNKPSFVCSENLSSTGFKNKQTKLLKPPCFLNSLFPKDLEGKHQRSSTC